MTTNQDSTSKESTFRVNRRPVSPPRERKTNVRGASPVRTATLANRGASPIRNTERKTQRQILPNLAALPSDLLSKLSEFLDPEQVSLLTSLARTSSTNFLNRFTLRLNNKFFYSDELDEYFANTNWNVEEIKIELTDYERKITIPPSLHNKIKKLTIKFDRNELDIGELINLVNLEEFTIINTKKYSLNDFLIHKEDSDEGTIFSNLSKLTKLSIDNYNGTNFFTNIPILTSLRIRNSSLLSTQSIETLINLKELDLQDSKILESIEGISKCKNLRNLNVAGDFTFNLKEIEDLKNLRELTISTADLKEEQIPDLSRTTSLTKLKILQCDAIPPLPQSLTSLYIEGMLSNSSGIENINLSNLISLTLENDDFLENLNAFEKCTKITTLTLNNCKRLTNLNSIQNFPELSEFRIVKSNDSVRDFEFLSKSISLTKLYVEKCSFENTINLDQCTKLKVLTLKDMIGIRSLYGFHDHIMEEITLDNLIHLTELNNCPDTIKLTIKNNKLSDLSRADPENGLYEDWKSITKLEIINSEYSHLGAIKNCTKMISLEIINSLNYDPINTTYSFLANFTKLSTLWTNFELDFDKLKEYSFPSITNLDITISKYSASGLKYLVDMFPNLENITLTRRGATPNLNLSFLNNFTKLISLTLDNIVANDLSLLFNIKNIANLTIKNSRDLITLRNLNRKAKWRKIEIFNAISLEDVDPFERMQFLEKAILFRSKITEGEQSKSFLQNHPKWILRTEDTLVYKKMPESNGIINLEERRQKLNKREDDLIKYKYELDERLRRLKRIMKEERGRYNLSLEELRLELDNKEDSLDSFEDNLEEEREEIRRREKELGSY